METSIGRILGTSSGRNFAEWEDVPLTSCSLADTYISRLIIVTL